MSSARSQLSLAVIPRLRYEPNQFMLHTGVASIFESLVHLLSGTRFSLCCVEGALGSGKTHLTVKLLEELLVLGCNPVLWEGREFAAELTSWDPSMVTDREVFLVDDVEVYLDGLSDSGPFVSFVEQLRLRGAGMMILSNKSMLELACDQHVLSRVRSGQGFVIGPPNQKELSELLPILARQRGLHLSERQLSYLLRRSGRDLPGQAAILDELVHKLKQFNQGANFRLLKASVEYD